MMAVFKRLAQLPDDTLVYPGHEYDHSSSHVTRHASHVTRCSYGINFLRSAAAHDPRNVHIQQQVNACSTPQHAVQRLQPASACTRVTSSLENASMPSTSLTAFGAVKVQSFNCRLAAGLGTVVCCTRRARCAFDHHEGEEQQPVIARAAPSSALFVLLAWKLY